MKTIKELEKEKKEYSTPNIMMYAHDYKKTFPDEINLIELKAKLKQTKAICKMIEDIQEKLRHKGQIHSEDFHYNCGLEDFEEKLLNKIKGDKNG